MKKHFLLASLICASSAAFQLPSFADHEAWFDKHDYDHDGRWNYKEYSKAERLWIKEHPESVRLSERDLHHQFEKYDKDHDGYVRAEEVRDCHHW